jgi:hypothetical protein
VAADWLTVKAEDHHFEIALEPRRGTGLAVVRTDDLWHRWQAAEVESGVALCDWLTSSESRKPGAYAEYQAALDREERAARMLAGRVDADGWR